MADDKEYGDNEDIIEYEDILCLISNFREKMKILARKLNLKYMNTVFYWSKL